MARDFDILFEPEDEALDAGLFEAEVVGAEVRCPECDAPYDPPTCEACGMAWFIPTYKEPLQ